MRAAPLLPAPAFAVLLLLPAAGAAPASGDLRAAPPLALSGAVALEAGEGVIVLPAVERLAAPAARLNVTLLRLGGEPARPAAPSPVDPVAALLREASEALRPGSGRGDGARYLEIEAPEALVVTTRQADARLLLAAGPFDAGALALEGSEARVEEAGAGALGALPEGFPEQRRPWLAASGLGSAAARGSVRGLASGLALLAFNASGALAIDALERGGERWVALLRWSGAEVRAASGEPFLLLAPRLGLRLEGALAAPRAWGGLAVAEEPHGARGEAVLARGSLEGFLAPGGGALRVRVGGHLAYLELGGERLELARAAAAGAGLALLSALAYKLRLLAAPLYARIAPSELLENEARRRVHDHVARSPGADVQEVAAAAGVSWSTAAYHLARLEREGLLLARRQGRSKRFFLHGGEASGRADALAALRNPTALAVAGLVASRPGLIQKEVAALLGLPPSTASWHLRRLRDLGVVEERRRWRRAEYAPGEAWPRLAPHLARPAGPAAAPAPPPRSLRPSPAGSEAL